MGVDRDGLLRLQFDIVETLEVSSEGSLMRSQPQGIVVYFWPGDAASDGYFFWGLGPTQYNGVGLGLLLDDLVHKCCREDYLSRAEGHRHCCCLLAL